MDREHSWGATLLHELGHLVGLAHVDDPDQLMSTYPGSVRARRPGRAGGGRRRPRLRRGPEPPPRRGLPRVRPGRHCWAPPAPDPLPRPRRRASCGYGDCGHTGQPTVSSTRV
jgi:hypothetical protein